MTLGRCINKRAYAVNRLRQVRVRKEPGIDERDGHATAGEALVCVHPDLQGKNRRGVGGAPPVSFKDTLRRLRPIAGCGECTTPAQDRSMTDTRIAGSDKTTTVGATDKDQQSVF